MLNVEEMRASDVCGTVRYISSLEEEKSKEGYNGPNMACDAAYSRGQGHKLRPSLLLLSSFLEPIPVHWIEARSLLLLL